MTVSSEANVNFSVSYF